MRFNLLLVLGLTVTIMMLFLLCTNDYGNLSNYDPASACNYAP